MDINREKKKGYLLFGLNLKNISKFTLRLNKNCWKNDMLGSLYIEGAQKSVITITKQELLDDFGSERWEKRLHGATSRIVG